LRSAISAHGEPRERFGHRRDVEGRVFGERDPPFQVGEAVAFDHDRPVARDHRDRHPGDARDVHEGFGERIDVGGEGAVGWGLGS